MPRHSPILQILVYFTVNNKNVIYIHIYLYTKTPSPKKRKKNTRKEKQCTRCHFGIQRKFQSKPERNVSNSHTHTYYFYPCINTVNLF